MNEQFDPIRRALRELPKERASESFTDAVLVRFDDNRRSAAPPLRWAAAFLVVLGLVAAFSWEQRQRGVETARRTRASALLEEQQRLTRELMELRTMAAQEPVVYLGGDESYELILSLSPWVEGELPNGEPQPAVYRKD